MSSPHNPFIYGTKVSPPITFLPCEIVNYYYYVFIRAHTHKTHSVRVRCAEFHELLNRKLALIYLIRTGTSISAALQMPHNVCLMGHLLR